ncbi:MAG: ABC transporter permease, partial [Candidatus Lokiarchaeota archaeon]
LLFNISQILPGDPVLAYLPPGPFTPEQYEQMREQLGLNLPLIIQFLLFPFKLLLGDWGRSLSIATGMPVFDLIMQRLPRTIDLLLVPLIIALPFGILLGRLSIKSRSPMGNRSIQLISLIGLAFPVFFIGMLLQFFLGYVFPILPTTGYKDYSYIDPPYATGFRIIDSMLSGNWFLIPDYLYHLILPWISLTIPILLFTIILVRMYLINHLDRPKDPEKRSIVPFMFYMGLGFGFIFAFLVLDEITFGLGGIGQLFLQAIYNVDYWVILGTIFIILTSFIPIITVSLLLFILYGYLKSRSHSKPVVINQKDIEVDIS